MTKENKVKIEISDFNTKKKMKKTQTKKVPVEKEAKKELNKKDFLEIFDSNFYLKVPNEIKIISKVKKILGVYEDELYLQKAREKRISEVTSEVSPIVEQVLSVAQPMQTQQVAQPIQSQPIAQPQQNMLQENVPIIEEQKNVEVKPYEHYDKCPLCSGKLKKKKLKRNGDLLTQKVVCKNRKCNFEREYTFSI